MKIWLILCSLFLLNSCTCHRLSVQTDYISRENLASYYVDTPDPLLNNPPIGQRLIISWSLPKEYLTYSDLHLNLIVRFHNREQQIQDIPIPDMRGTYLYEILNKQFCQTGGILTYKVTLMGNGCSLEEWRHPLWAHLITFEASHSCQQE